jgi:3-phenylpropionate/cinnamic acid dioxygenase small subunit
MSDRTNNELRQGTVRLPMSEAGISDLAREFVRYAAGLDDHADLEYISPVTSTKVIFRIWADRKFEVITSNPNPQMTWVLSDERKRAEDHFFEIMEQLRAKMQCELRPPEPKG